MEGQLKEDSNVAQVIQRAENYRKKEWCTPENVCFWYDAFGKELVDLGFGRYQEDNSSVTWNCPSRVILIVERGFFSEHNSLNQGKVASAARSLDFDDFVENADPRLHNLIAGHNVMGVIWILSSDTGMSPSRIAQASERAVTADELGPFRDVHCTDVLVGYGPKKQASRSHLIEFFIPAVKMMYPDLANEPGNGLCGSQPGKTLKPHTRFSKQCSKRGSSGSRRPSQVSAKRQRVADGPLESILRDDSSAMAVAYDEPYGILHPIQEKARRMKQAANSVEYKFLSTKRNILLNLQHKKKATVSECRKFVKLAQSHASSQGDIQTAIRLDEFIARDLKRNAYVDECLRVTGHLR